MSLTRKLLESMGLEADKVASIIEAHAETVDALKAQIEKAKGDSEKLVSVETELAKVQAEYNALKETGGDWQKKYETEHTEFENYKNGIEAKETKIAKENAYRKLLVDTGVSDKRIDAIMKVTKVDDYELVDGAFKDVDKLTEGIKAEWADFITTTNTAGASTTKPPKNDNVPRYSREDIAKMTAEEINANWDNIKDSMKG